jgi:crotonobetainyl-CoA:carnitine CoA-transferase CaiB-like acyl-CoA transferase
MRLGDTANDDAARYGKPLAGVRILAVEQMQALPWGTQLLSRLGAEIVKVEHPVDGESGRGSLPAMLDPEGRRVGCTYIRNNLGKKSVGIDLKKGRELILDLAGKFDIFAENFKPGAMSRMGLGYEDLSARWPHLIYVSVSGFGNTVETPYASWPAYAGVAEAMSGIYEFARPEGQRPTISPVGALGDIGTAVMGVVGMLAALRHRDHTGEGQYVDVAMYDTMISFTDLVTNYWSMGTPPKQGATPGLILTSFLASDGYFMVQVGRPHQFERFAEVIGHPEWLTDPTYARDKWLDILESHIRPAVEKWAADKSKRDICFILAEGGVACAPVHHAEDVVNDEHVQRRNMLVEVPRTDGVEQPILVPGNPIKMSKVQEGPEERMPWVGEHTAEILSAELGLSDAELGKLRDDGVIN